MFEIGKIHGVMPQGMRIATAGHNVGTLIWRNAKQKKKRNASLKRIVRNFIWRNAKTSVMQ